MSATKLEEVDPDGDTLLILRNPNAPFATWNSETDQPWANALPQYQSATSTSHEATVLPNEALDDEESTKAEAEPVDMRLRVCSAILKVASPFFKKSISGNWKATECEPGFEWTLLERDWDAEAFLMLMNILHHRTNRVPQTISLETLAKIATLVDYFDCHEAVNLWAEKWISNLTLDEPKYYSRELLLRLTVAIIFPDDKAFCDLTKVTIEKSRGPIHTLGLPIPHQVINAIEQKRIKMIGLFVRHLEGICGSLYSNDSGTCYYAELGYFEKNLFSHGLKPLPSAPYSGFSPETMLEAIHKFDKRASCNCGYENHLKDLRKKVLECTKDPILQLYNDLELQQFASKKRAGY